MKQLIFTIVILLALLSPGLSWSAVADDKPVSLVPAPQWLQAKGQGYAPGDSLVLDIGGLESMQEAAHWVASLISEHAGIPVSVRDGGESGSAIRLETIAEQDLFDRFRAAGLSQPAMPKQAYRLESGPDGVVIQAIHDTGLFYGLGSLWQILSTLPEVSSGWPGVEILDAPEFAWRGLMLDSARHMQSTEFIKRYIDWMALHKMNVFHWHLTDDQAWRLEIKSWPDLARVGGYRVPAGDAPAADIDSSARSGAA